MILTVDNYIGEASNDKTASQIKGIKDIGYTFNINKRFNKEVLSISLKDYQDKSSSNTFFSFFTDSDQKEKKNDDSENIISVAKTINGTYTAQSGNYVGKFTWNGIDIDIRSRFNNFFLERMLNFANDIFLDDVSVFDAQENKNNDLDFSKYIIYYMFIQKLEKAFLLGLPKAYRSVDHHEMKIKGKIDFNKFIKNDVPFQGKVSSSSREQVEIQEIIDVLYKAIKIIKDNGFSINNISHVMTHLKQNRSSRFVSSDIISQALSSRSLQNPIFFPYKKVLEYAKFIINRNSLEEKAEEKDQTYGFLVNVAELFEIYVTKLLQKEFPDWHIESPKIELYQNRFFERKIIPDIVMIKDKRVLVFDTKYKRMLMRNRWQFGGDVDRCDFFQINSYMSYYQNNNENYHVVAGGLLYPMEVMLDRDKCHGNRWFENDETNFIIDGIELSGLSGSNCIEELKYREQEFINRIRDLL